MMNFPNSPSNSQVFTAPNGAQYVYVNGVWMQVSAAQTLVTAQARNRVVNPAMQISQENGSTPGGTSGYYAADQWFMGFSGCTPQAIRATNAAADGGYSYGQSFSAVTASPAATAYCQNMQKIEGIRMADLLWGTANAKPVLLRFRAKNDVPGIYTACLMNAANDRSFTKAITLTTSWQDFTVAIPGDTIGVWPTGAVEWGSLRFPTVVGSNYMSATEGWHSDSKLGAPGQINGASVTGLGLYVTNVGLYLDDQNTGVAPPWEMPDEAQELAACQRYYEKIAFLLSTTIYGNSKFAAYKRVNPVMTTIPDSGTGGVIVPLMNPGTGWASVWQSVAHSNVAGAVVIGNARM